MRGPDHTILSLLMLICLCAPLCRAAPPDGSDASHLTKQQLIGAWRLVKIDYSGPKGTIVDPFYQVDSTGIIIYEAAGWMSVQIGAPHRRPWQVPALRLPASAVAQDVQLKAAAFDTYYAYYGTWEFIEDTSVATHHVKSSLIPAEVGLSYAQTVTLEGGRLVFTTRSKDKGGETVRRKIWERIVSVDR